VAIIFHVSIVCFVVSIPSQSILFLRGALKNKEKTYLNCFYF